MATQHELLIRLSADGRSLVAEVRSATGEIQRFAAEAQKDAFLRYVCKPAASSAANAPGAKAAAKRKKART